MFGFVRGVRGRAVVVVLVVAALLAGVTASSVVAGPSTTVTWKVSSLTAGQVKSLSNVASSNSLGVKTWSKTGSCTLSPTSRPTTLTMGTGKSCTLTLKIAKSGKYPAKTSTKIITKKSATTTTVAPTTTTVAPTTTTVAPTTTTVAPTTTTVAPVPLYSVGDTGPGGGTVFYKHASGTFACGATLNQNCTYLEVAPNTWSGGSADPTKLWADSAYQSVDISTITNDSSAYNNALGIGLGHQNSEAIVAQGNGTTTAAGAARAYAGGSQSDWYLPTTAELNLLCQWARNVAQSVTTVCTGGTLDTGTGASGGFSPDYYWSSSENDVNFAWGQYFDNGDQGGNPKGLTYYVRPVRAF